MDAGHQRAGQQTRTIVQALIVLDVLFIAAYLYCYITFRYQNELPMPVRWDLQRELSYASFYLLGKWALASALMVWLHRRQRQAVFLGLGLLFLYLFVDDAFQYHERVGNLLAKQLGLPSAWGLRGRDFGELLATAFVVVPGLLVLAWAAVTGSPRTRSILKVFVGLFVLLACVGILADMVHVAVSGAEGPAGVFLKLGFATLEDGGELIVGSLILGATLHLFRQPS